MTPVIETVWEMEQNEGKDAEEGQPLCNSTVLGVLLYELQDRYRFKEKWRNQLYAAQLTDGVKYEQKLDHQI